ncbi:MAG: HEAT repeat domain-containing protein [Planctomycetes bacterium]|nr:HEAT repeat domain-containing protein [Planctomycetota bacterium]
MKTPGFWQSIIALLVAVAAGNVVLVLGIQAASLLRPPLVHVMYVAAGAVVALLAPYLVCLVTGAPRDVRRTVLLSFAIAAIPFGLGLCAAQEVVRMDGLLVDHVPSWEMTLWRNEHLIARGSFALAFALATLTLCRRRRPVSWHRTVMIALIGISLAWVAKEWLHIHRSWQEPMTTQASAVTAFMRSMMLCASGHVFLPISLAVTAMLFLWEWPAHVPEEKRGRMLVRSVTLGVVLFTFAALAVLRPMVQGPRRMMTLIRALQVGGALTSKYQAELLRFGRPAVVKLKDVAADPGAIVAGRQCAVRMLDQTDTAETTAFLLDLLRDDQANVRTAAFRVLQKTHADELRERLVEMLGDEWAERRYFAAVALGRMGRRPAPRELVLAIQDESPHVRRAAVSALGRIGDASCVPELITALKDEDKTVCARAATALMRLRDKRAVPALREALNDESEVVRYLAAEALGRLGDREAIPVLIEAIEKGCGARPSKVHIDTRKMAEALAEAADASILFNLHSLYRNTSGRARKDVAYAIDLIREKERRGMLPGRPKPKE